MRRSIATLLAMVALMAAAAAGYAALGGAHRAAAPRAKIQPSPVKVTGDVSGLWPGMTADLPIRVRNLTDGPVELRWVRTKVRPADVECDPANLHTEQIWPRQRIPAGARIDLVVPVTLDADAGNFCQGATFPLRYRTRVNVLGAGR
jgi:hypothetical protein